MPEDGGNLLGGPIAGPGGLLAIDLLKIDDRGHSINRTLVEPERDFFIAVIATLNARNLLRNFPLFAPWTG